MLDIDTFLTLLYCQVDEFCKTLPPEVPRPGETPALSRSEVVTLAIFGQWSRFQSERDFYRFAEQRLRSLFPRLPHRTQFNRQARLHSSTLTAFCLHLSQRLQAASEIYEALDCTAAPTRHSKRRGLGWLPGEADIGESSRLGWFEGFRLILAITPSGVITGFGIGAASAKDQPLAEAFFALRCDPQPGYESVGAMASSYLYLPEWGETEVSTPYTEVSTPYTEVSTPYTEVSTPYTEVSTPYLADGGFEGEAAHHRWSAVWGAKVLSPPKRNSRTPWPKSLRRWLASLRQIVETVFEKLHNSFRLDQERPHQRQGFLARLAAKVALHNFSIRLNLSLGRPQLAFADLLGWV
jgi:hypothetical protein